MAALRYRLPLDSFAERQRQQTASTKQRTALMIKGIPTFAEGPRIINYFPHLNGIDLCPRILTRPLSVCVSFCINGKTDGVETLGMDKEGNVWVIDLNSCNSINNQFSQFYVRVESWQARLWRDLHPTEPKATLNFNLADPQNFKFGVKDGVENFAKIL